MEVQERLTLPIEGAPRFLLQVGKGTQLQQDGLELVERIGSRMSHDTSPSSLYGPRFVDVRAQVQADLTAAVKARDSVRIAALRVALGAIANAEAVASDGRVSLTAPAGSTEVARRDLSDDDVRLVVERERAELLGAADERERLGRPGDAVGLRAQAAVLEGYLE